MTVGDKLAKLRKEKIIPRSSLPISWEYQGSLSANGRVISVTRRQRSLYA